MSFPSYDAVIHHIHNSALAQGRRVIVDPKASGGSGYTYICSSKTPCTYRCGVIKAKGTRSSRFFVSSMIAEHDGCNGLAKPTARQVVQLTSTISAVQSNHAIPARQLGAFLRSRIPAPGIGSIQKGVITVNL